MYFWCSDSLSEYGEVFAPTILTEREPTPTLGKKKLINCWRAQREYKNNLLFNSCLTGLENSIIVQLLIDVGTEFQHADQLTISQAKLK